MILEVKEDESGELYIELPDDLLASLGWVEGDVLEWIEENGSYTIKKKQDKKESVDVDTGN